MPFAGSVHPVAARLEGFEERIENPQRPSGLGRRYVEAQDILARGEWLVRELASFAASLVFRQDLLPFARAGDEAVRIAERGWNNNRRLRALDL